MTIRAYLSFFASVKLIRNFNFSFKTATSRSQVLLLISVLILEPTSPAFSQIKSTTSSIDKIIMEMTLEQKVGQLFMVGFPSKRLDKRLKQFVKKYQPGSFIFFRRNIEDLDTTKAFIEDLIAASKQNHEIEPFFAIDQEGGAVSRLAFDPPLANASALGATGSTEIADDFGYQVGRILKSIGFNMNLAPVLDVVGDTQASMIGARSLGHEPHIVDNIGEAVGRGLLRAGVIPTAKHFPGMGSTNEDPHKKLVSYTKQFSELLEFDVRAFLGFASIGNHSAVMLSHLAYPSLDPTGRLATFSTAIIRDLLRTRLKYTGLIITDDLMMDGSSDLNKAEAASLYSLLAGADIAMMTWSYRDQERSIQGVVRAVQDGRLSAAELNAKVKRILIAKAFVASGGRAVPSRSLASIQTNVQATPDEKILVRSKEILKLDQRIVAANLNRGIEGFLKLNQSNSVCVFSTQNSFLKELRSRIGKKNYRYFLATQHTNKTQLKNLVDKSTCERFLFLATHHNTAKVLSELPDETKRFIHVINTLSPGLFANDQKFSGFVNLYFNHQTLAAELAKILAAFPVAHNQGTSGAVY